MNENERNNQNQINQRNQGPNSAMTPTNSQDENLKRRQQAGRNTAHVVGRGLSRAAGGELGGRIYDATSKTKLGQAVEKGVGNRIAKTPIAGSMNQKLNDSGAVDKANQVVDLAGGKSNSSQRSNPKKDSSDVPEGLKKPRRRGRFLPGAFSKTENDDSKEEDKNESEPEKEVEEEPGQELKGSVGVLKKLLPIVVAIMIITAIFAPLAISAPVLNVVSWFQGLFHHTANDANIHYIYKNDPEMLEKEIAFYNAIRGSSDGSVKGIVREYQEKYGVTLDWYLLQSTIVYRYTLVDSDKAFTSDGNDQVGSDELEDKIEEINENDGEAVEEQTSINIDFTEANKKIETVAELMLTNNNGVYSTDKEKGGEFYNRLVESDFLKTYYSDFLVNDALETRQKLVDEIFDYANAARELLEEPETSSLVASDSIQVHLQTCDLPYKYTTISSQKIYNNPSSTGTYPESLNMRDYLKGVVYGELGAHEMSDDKKEAFKAQMIAALTYIIRDSNTGFSLRDGNMYIPAGNCRQLCCDPNVGCTYRHHVYYHGTTFGTSYSGPDRFSVRAFSREGLNESQNQYLDSILDEIFGYVIVKKGVTANTFEGSKSIPGTAGNYLNTCDPGICLSQQGALQDAKSGSTYIEILNKYYANVDGGAGFDLINIKEGLYFESTGNYNGSIQLNEAFHYHQKDSEWKSDTLCDSGSIGGNGCNITSAAIAISLLRNERITPRILNNRQKEIKTCLQSSRPLMIMDFAKLYGLTATSIKKRDTAAVNDMLQKLSTGNYAAVLRLAGNSGRYSTGEGHYIAAVSVKTENGKNKLLIWDPGSTRASRDNYWADLETDLIPHLRAEYSFILIGR